MIEQFCDYQMKCKEDNDNTWTCTAHLADGWAPQCSFSTKNLKVINGQLMMTHKGELVGRCQDWQFTQKGN